MPRSATRIARLRRRSAVVLVAAYVAALSACGGSADDTTAPPRPSPPAAAASASQPSTTSSAPSAEVGDSLTVTGVDFAVSLDRTDLTAGEYEIEFVNEGRASHDVRVERDGEDIARSAVIGPGETSTFTVTLEPGEYVFYCSVGNHRGMGMETTVTVAG